MKRSDLADSQQALVSMMSGIACGKIEKLRVREGKPWLDPPPLVVRTVKFGIKGASGPDVSGDFALKKKVVELFAVLRDLQEGTVRRIEVRSGLPILVELESYPRAGGQDG